MRALWNCVSSFLHEIENLVLKYQEVKRRKICSTAVINSCGSVTFAYAVSHGPCSPGATNNEACSSITAEFLSSGVIYFLLISHSLDLSNSGIVCCFPRKVISSFEKRSQET